MTVIKPFYRGMNFDNEFKKEKHTYTLSAAPDSATLNKFKINNIQAAGDNTIGTHLLSLTNALSGIYDGTVAMVAGSATKFTFEADAGSSETYELLTTDTGHVAVDLGGSAVTIVRSERTTSGNKPTVDSNDIYMTTKASLYPIGSQRVNAASSNGNIKAGKEWDMKGNFEVLRDASSTVLATNMRTAMATTTALYSALNLSAQPAAAIDPRTGDRTTAGKTEYTELTLNVNSAFGNALQDKSVNARSIDENMADGKKWQYATHEVLRNTTAVTTATRLQTALVITTELGRQMNLLQNSEASDENIEFYLDDSIGLDYQEQL